MQHFKRKYASADFKPGNGYLKSGYGCLFGKEKENKKENTLSTKKTIKKKRKISPFLGRFLSRERVFFGSFPHFDLIFFHEASCLPLGTFEKNTLRIIN